jgi:predicted alpha-1,6-mannanase (GH76 family)
MIRWSDLVHGAAGKRQRTISLLIGGAMVIASACASAAEESFVPFAEHAQLALRHHYWDDHAHLFRNRADQGDPAMGDFNYWWQAHALSAVSLAVARGSTVWQAADLVALRTALLARNGGHWTNDYFDDEGWMAIAMRDAAAATGDQGFRAVGRLLWDDIRVSWNDSCGGGIPWRRQQRDYKNAPANGPAMLLGAAFAQDGGQAEDLPAASRIATWLLATLRDPGSGLIWDGINRTGKNEIDKGWRFTYVQGIVIGACLEMRRATHQDTWRESADCIASAALTEWFAADTGLCRDHGGKGDGGLFKGILVRYLGALAAESPTLRGRIRSALAANARRLGTLQAAREDALLPATWDAGSAPGDLELSTHLSAVLLGEGLLLKAVR